MFMLTDPRAIEQKSMSIIEENLPGLLARPVGEREIIKRVVHTTGDLTVADLVLIHPRAVESGLCAIRSGRPVVTDINMLKAGINAGRLTAFGMSAQCYISDPVVAEEAKREGLTRAMVAMRRAAKETPGGIVAIGNAPTALFELCELIERGEASPALVVGTPVGFVGAKESKEALVALNTPYVTIPGTRGGSAIAASVVNALLYLA